MHHAHEHEHEEQNFKKLRIILVLTVFYMIAEILGGIFSNSLALLADAGHMFSDAAALCLSFFVLWLSLRPASPKKTFGYYRSEILAAFVNGIALIGISIFIIYEAYIRITHVPEVQAPVLVGVATGGLVINIIGALMLHGSSKENLNIHGAFLHILGDLLGSIGAIIAGLLIIFFKFYLADPIISIIIAILIFISAFKLVMEAINILLEASPSHISVEAINLALLELSMVDDVYDLHVWSISSKKIALSVHVVTSEPDHAKVLCEVSSLLKKNFEINHITVQVEPHGFDEKTCSF